MAKMHFKYGAMNSGKSDSLIKTAYNYTERGLKVATIKPGVDTKGNDLIVARGGAKRKVDILIPPEGNLKLQVEEFMSKHKIQHLNIVLVDEAQFLQTEQVDQLFEIAKTDGISVIAYGLRTDFRTEMFPGSKRFFEVADNLEKLPTMCKCGSQAEFNCRKVDGVFVFEGDQVAIDGENTTEYESLCGSCYQQQRQTL